MKCICALLVGLFVFTPTTALASSECVVLLHGLARSAGSMGKLEQALASDGYQVANTGYPSRKENIQTLAPIAIESGLAACEQNYSKVHFVTHSLGGILVRSYLQDHELERLGRVVMIGPPNQGSQVVDNLKNVPGFKLINGPAGVELGTDKDSVPVNLGPVTFELGVVAGTKTFNPLLSQLLPNPDDGKVSVASTKVEGMQDFITAPHTHTFLMDAEVVIQQTKHFLRTGRFQREQQEP